MPERVPSLRRDRAFLSLAAGMALGLVAQIGLIAHLLSALAPLLGAQTAGIAMGWPPPPPSRAARWWAG